MAKARRIPRTSAGLRDALFDEIDNLREGDGDPQQAIAVANLARNIIAIAKMEYQVAKDGTGTTPCALPLGKKIDDDPESESFIPPPDKSKLMAGR